MTPVTAHLYLSAKGLRMAGYLLETNLRVAQVFGQAALHNNPFLPKPVAKALGATVSPMSFAETRAKVSSAPARRKAGKVSTPAVNLQALKPEASKPSAPKAAPKAAEAQPDTANGTNGANGAKKPRQPSAPPAMPESLKGEALAPAGAEGETR
ncbi:MAG: hypothetical protein RIG84_13355 [Roseovarius sp.]